MASRAPKIKNKNPAPVQITAEQILREAQERQDAQKGPPRQGILDGEELSEYQLRRRKEFEDALRRNRLLIGTWLKYAAFEESQKEFDRARSIFERALDVDPRNVTLFMRYAEMEMKNRNVNLARNVFDRAVTILPRVDQFWLKYTYMEEMLGNVVGARQVFERWMQWEPDEVAWQAYIKMERRYGETERARRLFDRFVFVHPDPKNWQKWAKFEEDLGNIDKVREIFGQAIEILGDEHIDQKIFIAFAKFETKLKEYERARVIYKYALERIPRAKSESLYNQYTQFEKQYGDKEEIEEVVVAKRRLRYEEEVRTNPKNYDAWFDLTRLEESADLDRIRDTYERAIAQVPPSKEKRLWRRYIFLWLYYAIFEEAHAKDIERARQVYTECIKLIPHRIFTFAKVWLQYARFEIRQMNLAAARKILGTAIGMAPKDKLFKGYIELELQLSEFDRVRTLYSKYLEFNPANCTTWIRFAELERSLGDLERCRAVFELAISQPVLDMPELLWKAYIDFETEENEYENTRKLYEQLLRRTDHVKVWISYAQFELGVPKRDAGAIPPIEHAHHIMERAYGHMKEQGLKEERVVLLEAWMDIEQSHGTPETLQDVEAKKPKMVKKSRQVVQEDGNTVSEEYYDYIFPDDEDQRSNLRLLEMAHQWKMNAQKLKQKQQ